MQQHKLFHQTTILKTSVLEPDPDFWVSRRRIMILIRFRIRVVNKQQTYLTGNVNDKINDKYFLL